MVRDNIERCSRCNKDKSVAEFKGRKPKLQWVLWKKKKYRDNNQEKIKEYNKVYNQKSYMCFVCNLEVKVQKKTQHEQTVSHQYYLQFFENNEEPRKPDKIETIDGRIIYHCFACKCSTWQNSWGGGHIVCNIKWKNNLLTKYFDTLLFYLMYQCYLLTYFSMRDLGGMFRDDEMIVKDEEGKCSFDDMMDDKKNGVEEW